LFESKRDERSADRFRRLCQHIACHWVYDEREDWGRIDKCANVTPE
jgi:hypothetical protein